MRFRLSSGGHNHAYDDPATHILLETYLYPRTSIIYQCGAYAIAFTMRSRASSVSTCDYFGVLHEGRND